MTVRVVGKLALLGAVAALGFGCAAAPSNVLEGDTAVRQRTGPAVSERVVISSRALSRALKYGEVVTRREGLLLHVQVAIENVRRAPVDFEYRWEWTDAEGFQLGDTLSRWQPTSVNGNEHRLLTGVGPGPAAVNFRLYIRPPGG
jgi:uncharacterized protein YcfL